MHIFYYQAVKNETCFFERGVAHSLTLTLLILKKIISHTHTVIHNLLTLLTIYYYYFYYLAFT